MPSNAAIWLLATCPSGMWVFHLDWNWTPISKSYSIFKIPHTIAGVFFMCACLSLLTDTCNFLPRKKKNRKKTWKYHLIWTAHGKTIQKFWKIVIYKRVVWSSTLDLRKVKFFSKNVFYQHPKPTPSLRSWKLHCFIALQTHRPL